MVPMVAPMAAPSCNALIYYHAVPHDKQQCTPWQDVCGVGLITVSSVQTTKEMGHNHPPLSGSDPSMHYWWRYYVLRVTVMVCFE
jgi:hypothetical protein